MVDFPASHIDWPEETKYHGTTIILEKTQHLQIFTTPSNIPWRNNKKTTPFCQVTSSMIRAWWYWHESWWLGISPQKGGKKKPFSTPPKKRQIGWKNTFKTVNSLLGYHLFFFEIQILEGVAKGRGKHWSTKIPTKSPVKRRKSGRPGPFFAISAETCAMCSITERSKATGGSQFKRPKG